MSIIVTMLAEEILFCLNVAVNIIYLLVVFSKHNQFERERNRVKVYRQKSVDLLTSAIS